ncbi:hypothetical protein BKA82DRAFT_1005953 [Pisolithus tinctorius]|uniref:G domain-containing protein n=1 Tax=Pisolithus tinctorius Marx 270 TaxID=870435 RepID=A0A0C3JIV3_PISTI|nr:hypothetical protein BKA82DRAFT_1005953 [Pisolithus tinctorius]KIN97536.1 hypothetical protein M404DRAFT_1005953 [Pisolithus tinctorius Marx 270]
MGPTDSGKTTFIDRAVGRPDLGGGSTSCTKKVHPVRYPHSDGVRNIVLADTPGCDNSFMTDFQVLWEIAQWLNAVYIKKIKLSGILYFHRISDPRIEEGPLRNYKIFKELCGKDNCKNVILVTTMWDEVREEVGSEREQELQSDFWRAMISLGSTTRRFEGTTESARDIINSVSILQPAEHRPLQIQREMVDKHLPLDRTSAGRTIIDRLLNLRPRPEGIFARLKKVAGRPNYRTTRITVTLTDDDPTDTQPVGMGVSSSGICSVEGYQSALGQVIPALRASELVHTHYLKDAVAPCLNIALSIETMTGTHHALFQVLETATLLINAAFERAKKARFSSDIKAAVNGFAKKLCRILPKGHLKFDVSFSRQISILFLPARIRCGYCAKSFHQHPP